MKLRRYNQFINESVEITGDLLEILKERGKFWNEIFELNLLCWIIKTRMNKEILIDKIAFISEELQVQSMDWLKRGYQITPLEVGVFLSNINYLAEQANYLNHFLYLLNFVFLAVFLAQILYLV